MMAVSDLRSRLLEGMVIPAHPLALTARRSLDEARQRTLTRYYLAAGVGGVAVGVHTTQFEIHDPKVGLYRPVLELAVEETAESARSAGRPPVKVAGVVGARNQAIQEASLAKDLGYDCVLLSLGALKDANEDELIDHATAVSEIMPLFGFYLQPAVGGRILNYRFWRRFVEIDRVVAVKIAPFNRYYTIDVARAVAESGRENEIALYTGNDDNILMDLLSGFRFQVAGERKTLRVVGGLLGQWAVWTRRAGELWSAARKIAKDEPYIPSELLKKNVEWTDANAAIFDVANEFAGCIPGIHEILCRQGLLAGRWCLDPKLDLSPGQMEEIDRVCTAYPHLNDDEFVREFLEETAPAGPVHERGRS